MAALGSQSIASSYEQLLHVDRDDGGNSTTHVSVKDGDNGTTFGFTIASDALMMSSTNRLEFGDTGTYIHQSADGVLDLVSDTEIEINATTIDMNGAVDISGNAQLSGTVTVGADGSGTDVIFYSGTAGDNFTWDASEEKLTITGTNGQTALDVADGNVSITDDLSVDGTLEADAITVDGTALATYIRDTVGTNMLSSNTESGITVTYDTSNDNIDFAVDASQTGLTSILNASLVAGRDADNQIKFSTDDEIIFRVAGGDGVTMKASGEIEATSLDIGGASDIAGNLTLSGSSATRYLFFNAGDICGVWNESNTNLRFGTNDTERARIEADGVFVAKQGIELEGTSIASGQTGIASSGDGGDLRLYTNGTQNVTVDSDNGNVGIGVDPGTDKRLAVANTALNMNGATFYGYNQGIAKTTGTTDNGDDLYGMYLQTEFNDNSNYFGDMYGIHTYTWARASTGETDAIYGTLHTVDLTDIDVNNAYGQHLFVDGNGFTVDNQIYGQLITVDVESGQSVGGVVYGQYINMDSDTDPSAGVVMQFLESNSNADDFFKAYSNAATSVRAVLTDAGVFSTEGAHNASASLDYAEYFESKNGKAIAVGTTVKLDGDKIVPCEDGDTPIGVIRPLGTSAVVGGNQQFHWADMYEKDDYGAYVYEDFTWTQWESEVSRDVWKSTSDNTEDNFGGTNTKRTESSIEATYYDDADEENKDIPEGKKIGDEKTPKVNKKYFIKYKYHTDKIPSDLTVPSDAKVIEDGHKRQKLNSAYDASKHASYKNREEREEWCIVGLLGQIQITKGQPVASNWIKMKDVSSKVEMYFVK